MGYGASKKDWTLFSDTLGLTSDLLPVVSNPNAKVSPKSTLKALGKVPSLYNINREVAGIKDWTQLKATKEKITKWSQEEDYGICIQTRNVRAIDIDADNEISDKILEFISLAHPSLPVRFRRNSKRKIIAFRIGGELPKRSCKVADGIIEFLGTGNQFVAAGTHPSKVRYEWDWGNTTDFPTLLPEELERLWSSLVERFGIAPASEGVVRQKGQNLNLADATADYLREHGHVLSESKNGQLNIDCPNKAQHTTDNGDTQTSYFPAGTHGYELGAFKCLHAHCAGLSQEYFLDAFGVRLAEFDALPNEIVVKGGSELLPGFDRTKSGDILPTIDNLCLALGRPDFCGFKLAFDTFRDEVMIAKSDSELSWVSFRDIDYTIIQRVLERQRGFKPINVLLLHRAVALVAWQNRFDSAVLWLESLKWDGVARVDTFVTRTFGADNNAYSRAVSRYIWTALAGRILEPGCKADMVPILEGAQGTVKSTAIAAMVPSVEFFTDLSFNEGDAELARKMKGKLIAEIAELRGLRTKELESIKAFVTRTHEHWRPLYHEKTTVFARRLLFIGTTNQDAFLADETGNRRWLPIHVVRADVASIKRDREQLWAEGKEIFMKSGIAYREAETLATVVHADYRMEDSRTDLVREWIYRLDDLTGEAPINKGYLKLDDVLRYALNFDARSLKGHEGKDIAKILITLGFSRKKKRIDGGIPCWVWVPQGALPDSDLY